MPPSRKSFPNPRKAFKKAGRGASLKKRIKTLEARIGQKGVAKFLGVSPRSVRRYKQGTRKPGSEVLVRLRRSERVAKGLRRTKSIKRKAARKAKIILEHPEVLYFEARKAYFEAETGHIELHDVHVADIEGLIAYLREEGCDAAFFVVKGIDSSTLEEGFKREERFFSSEIMAIDDFAEDWRQVLAELLAQYGIIVKQIDLIGIKYNAPAPQKR